MKTLQEQLTQQHTESIKRIEEVELAIISRRQALTLEETKNKTEENPTNEKPNEKQTQNEENATKKDKTKRAKNTVDTQTYASVLSTTVKSIIITTKTDNSDAGDIKKDMNTNVDPTDFNISSITQISKKSIAIQCENETERDKLKDELKNKLGEKYEVNEPVIKNMQIKMVGINIEPSGDEIVKQIKKQNENVTDKMIINLIKIYKNKKGKQDQYGAILEVDYESCMELLKTPKLKLGWDICKLYEYTNLRRCFKCHGFNHTSKACTKQNTCAKCAGEHIESQCESEEKKCANCIEANLKFNLKLKTEHSPYDRICETMIKQINKMKKTVKYQ